MATPTDRRPEVDGYLYMLRGVLSTWGLVPKLY